MEKIKIRYPGDFFPINLKEDIDYTILKSTGPTEKEKSRKIEEERQKEAQRLEFERKQEEMRLAREKKAAELLAKVAAAAPDKKKLNDFAEMLDNLEYPKMTTEKGLDIFEAVRERISDVSLFISHQANIWL